MCILKMDDSRINPIHRAIVFAALAHSGQKRKGTDLDYIVHPLEVLHLLTLMNGSRELMIAGVLHDTVEDTQVTLDDIEAEFGSRVAYLVASHTEDKSKTWQERKQYNIDLLYREEREVKLLNLADKLSNLRSMQLDYLNIGDDLWKRFRAPKDKQAWLSGEMLKALADLENDEYAGAAYQELKEIHHSLFGQMEK